MHSTDYQLQESLSYVISRSSKAIRKYVNLEIIRGGYSVSGEQYDVLVQLLYKDGQNQQTLAEKLCKDKTTVTRLIKSVEDSALVTRVTNKEDERQKLVYLTQTGRNIATALSGRIHEFLLKAQVDIEPAHLKICSDVLRKLYKTLAKELARELA